MTQLPCEPRPAPERPASIDLAALALLTVIGAAVRVAHLRRPMEIDEAYSYNEYASRPLIEGLGWYTFPNNHLLNTLLVHLTTSTFGVEPWAVRLPSLVAGILLIPAGFALATAFCGRSAGLFTAALIAGSGPLIDYSTNARGYGFVALATAVLATLARRIRDGSGGLGRWMAFVVVAALGLFAIPIMLYPAGGIALWLVPAALGRNRRVRLDRLVLAGLATAALTVLLYVPVLLGTGLRSLVANPFVTPRPWPEVLHALPGTLIEAWQRWGVGLPPVVPAVVAVSGLLVMIRPGPTRRGASALGGLMGTVLVWSVSVALAQRVIPYSRVWLFLLPLAAAVGGAGLADLVDRWAGSVRAARLIPWLAFGLGVILAVLVTWDNPLDREAASQTLYHADDIAAFLGPLLGPDDAVAVAMPFDPPLKFAFLRRGVPVEFLYDYRVARARRLFLVVEPAAGQTPASVLKANGVVLPPGDQPRLVRDWGATAVYVWERGRASVED